MLNLKMLIIKIFVLFLCHELSVYFISENLNFRITEQLFLRAEWLNFIINKNSDI